jgi:predicted Zn-dependent peptidase
VAVTWAGPAAGAPDASAYALAFRALAQGFASRLNLRLREAEALTYGVDGAYTDGAGYGLSQVQLRVDGGRVVDALAALRTELDRLGRGDLDVAALQAARAGAWVERAGDGATRVGLASQLGTEMLFGLAPGETARRLAMYRDVSLAEANAAAIRWLGTPRLWVVTGDRDTLEPALDAAGWPVDTLMSACTAVYGGPCPAR